MQYTGIYLSGFKRIALTGHRTIDIQPHAPLQLILGTNGSGKSALMREISPLPAEKDAFIPNGKKVITLTHLNEAYTLTTEFLSPSTKCSFFRHSDQTELNPGGTQAVQLTLIEEILGYTPEVHRLLHGLETFTGMSPQKRREYFQVLCPTSYEYAMVVWQSMRNKLRDTQGAIKHTQARLVTEHELGRVDPLDLKAQMAQLEKEILNLQTLKLPSFESLPKPESTKRLSDDLKRALKYIYKQYVSNTDLFTDVHTGSQGVTERDRDDLATTPLETLQSRSTGLLGALASISGKLEQLHAQFEEVNQLSQSSQHRKAKEETYHRLKQETDETLQALKHHPLNFSIPEDANRRLRHFEQNETKLMQVLEEVPSIRDDITETSLEHLEIQFSIVNEEYRTLQQRQAQGLAIQEELQSHLANPEQTCPKCHHVYRPGLDEPKLRRVEQRLKEIQQQLSQLEPKLTQFKKEIHDQQTYLKQVNALKTLMSYWPEHQDYFALLNPEHPTALVQQAGHYKRHLSQVAHYQEQLKHLTTLETELNQLSQMDEGLIEQQNEKRKQLEKQISQLTEKQTDLLKEQAKVNSLIKAFDLLQETVYALKQLQSEQTDFIKAEIRKSYNDVLDTAIRQLQSRLGQLANQYTEVSMKEEVTRSLERDMANLKADEEAYKVLIDELSPMKGLIAEGLNGFVQAFVKEMNLIISRVWSYPLMIKMPDFEESQLSLNYKFPMLVNDEHLIPDVNAGSTGIKEVVNLAFKLTAMRFMGIADYPLFLDEFGASFDQRHRNLAAQVIKSLLEERTHAQLFMVSHYADAYGALVNADVIVLNPDNIIIPTERYNLYTTFS